MQLTFVILSALSLLNVGVQGATIAKALTSREAHQVPRSFHNADFGSATSQGKNLPATRHSDRAVLDAINDTTSSENLTKTSATEVKTDVVDENAQLNQKFVDYEEPIVGPLLQAMQDTTGLTRRDADSVSLKTPLETAPTKPATSPSIEPLRNGVSSSSDASSSAVQDYKNAVSSSPAVTGVSSSSVDPASPHQSLVSGPPASLLDDILGTLSLPSSGILSPSERRSNVGTEVEGKPVQLSSGI